MPVWAIVLTSVVGITVIVLIAVSIRYWIVIYNKFQYWRNRAERKLADIDVVLQQRIDNLHALAQVAKKYDIHEYKALTDVIQARAGIPKNADINQRVDMDNKVENSFMRLQAVMEQYPDLKADKMHIELMKRDNAIEHNLKKQREEYNKVIQDYNERVSIFPRNIVASVHKFRRLDYLSLDTTSFDPKTIFEDKRDN